LDQQNPTQDDQRLSIEREKLALEREKFLHLKSRDEQTEKSIGRHITSTVAIAATLATIFVSIASTLLSAYKAHLENSQKSIQAERDWRFQAAKLVSDNRAKLFSENYMDRDLAIQVLKTALSVDLYKEVFAQAASSAGSAILRNYLWGAQDVFPRDVTPTLGDSISDSMPRSNREKNEAAALASSAASAAEGSASAPSSITLLSRECNDQVFVAAKALETGDRRYEVTVLISPPRQITRIDYVVSHVAFAKKKGGLPRARFASSTDATANYVFAYTGRTPVDGIEARVIDEGLFDCKYAVDMPHRLRR